MTADSGEPTLPARRRERPSVLTLAAPAKVNLVLEVGERRPDGFHELRSVFAPLALADTLAVRVMAGSDADAAAGVVAPAAGDLDGARDAGAGPDTLSILGASDLPVEGNLVLRAAALLRADVARALPPLEFRLRKRIPAAAGLGGGSSDALAALDLAAAAWGIRLAARRRLVLAERLGSDVPFFCVGGWALVGGRGERLQRLPPPLGGPLGVLLVVPAARLSTRDVFSAFDAQRAKTCDPGRAPSRAPSRARGAGAGSVPRPATALARRLRAAASPAQIATIEPANDLAPAADALLDGLAEARAGIGTILGRPVHLSGSGPSMAVLYPSPGYAREAAAIISAAIARGALHVPGGSGEVIATTTGPERPARRRADAHRGGVA